MTTYTTRERLAAIGNLKSLDTRAVLTALKSMGGKRSKAITQTSFGSFDHAILVRLFETLKNTGVKRVEVYPSNRPGMVCFSYPRGEIILNTKEETHASN